MMDAPNYIPTLDAPVQDIYFALRQGLDISAADALKLARRIQAISGAPMNAFDIVDLIVIVAAVVAIPFLIIWR